MAQGHPGTADATAGHIGSQHKRSLRARMDEARIQDRSEDKGRLADEIPKEAYEKYFGVLDRIRKAEARIKEAKARHLELDVAKRQGMIIESEDVLEWMRQLLAAVRNETEAMPQSVDLLGLMPEHAGPLKKLAQELMRKLRARIGNLPELKNLPEPVGDKELIVVEEDESPTPKAEIA